MNTRTATITAAILLAGCASAGPSPSPVPAATASAPAVAATIAATPAATATGPASVLEGTWVAATNCARQAAAVDAAGFTAAQQEAAGWDAATCMDMGHGSRMQLRFAGERLIVFQDGTIGWDGVFRIVDGDTFEAGDSGSYYLTYVFAVAGDQLTIDMVGDDFPTSDPAELAGEQIAQTVIYESAPFEKAS